MKMTTIVPTCVLSSNVFWYSPKFLYRSTKGVLSYLILTVYRASIFSYVVCCLGHRKSSRALWQIDDNYNYNIVPASSTSRELLFICQRSVSIQWSSKKTVSQRFTDRELWLRRFAMRSQSRQAVRWLTLEARKAVDGRKMLWAELNFKFRLVSLLPYIVI